MDKDLITITLDGSGFSHDHTDIFTLSDDVTIDLSYNAANTINVGDITIPYISGTSDTITIGQSSGYSSIDLTTGLDGLTEWMEDQRIVEEYREEKAIRERNEGVQAAWEQYKIMVALAKEPPENLDNLE